MKNKVIEYYEELLGKYQEKSDIFLDYVGLLDIFQNQDGTVTSLISREDYYAAQSEKFVSETFDGSLPAFFAAFTKRKSISQKDLEEIRRMIDSFEEG